MSTHSTTSDLLDQSRPIREVWTQAWPTVLTMTSYTVMQFIDSLMVARIGHLEVAAQGNGGVWSFAVICFGFGLLTVVNTFVAQHLGAGEKSSTARYGWSSIWISLLMWLVVLLASSSCWVWPSICSPRPRS